eukprot:7814022-Alexandrium_andersonii.AAC.1
MFWIVSCSGLCPALGSSAEEHSASRQLRNPTILQAAHEELVAPSRDTSSSQRSHGKLELPYDRQCLR